MLATLKARVAENALSLARNGVPRKPFYVTGQAGGKAFSVHAEGERVILTRGEGEREEVELVAPARPAEELPAAVAAGAALGSEGEAGSEEPEPPGASSLDEGLTRLAEIMGEGAEPSGGER